MIPLRIRSYYSLMQGLLAPADICRRAKEYGHDCVALTDRDNLYGLWSFLSACRREGIRPIIGAEVSEPNTSRILTCLVKDTHGYKNLCSLLTNRHCQNDFSLLDLPARVFGGLIVLSDDVELLARLWDLELDPVADLGPRPTEKASILRGWATSRGIRSVVTHDCGIGSPDDYETFALLRAIDNNSAVSDAAKLYRREDVYSFESPEVYLDRFAMWPEAVMMSHALAKECIFEGPEFGLVMPPWNGKDSAGMLRERAYRGAAMRYGNDLSEVVVERLEHELDIIEKMGFSSYFLVVRDIVHRVDGTGRRKRRRICGRGSGAASLVAYCLEITNVCPVKFNLYFERFLNPGRVDPPDIDIDFAWDERDQVLEEVLQDHKEHAAMVCNHIFFKPRMAIRETAKAHGMPGYEISRITKKIPWMYAPGGDLFAQVENMVTLRDLQLKDPWPQLIRQAGKLIGIPRHLSVHPGGIVITPGPIRHYVPVERAPKGVPIVQWEKDGVEEAGLVKIDLLGNRSLGVIRDCIASVKRRGGYFDERRWEPEDDPLTRESVARGRTMGCFYIESPAMRLLQKKAGTGDYEQLVIQSSIIRPAANDFVREYVRRLHGGVWQPLHPELGDVLDETFGLMVYQEDVSRVAVRLAGFSHARADGLRKVMSKKDKLHRLADYRQQFVDGCRRKAITDDDIDKMWTMMMSFDGYSFCKPHSASYAKVSFQAAYLKTYFPAEFMAAVISNQGGYYSTFAYVSEAKRLGVKILQPDVNLSDRKWQGKNGTVRVGLMAVLGVSERLMERIVLLRERGGNFLSPADFFHRTRPAEDEARRLIHAGALDSLQEKKNRTVLLWELAAFRRMVTSSSRMPLFGIQLPSAPSLQPPLYRDKLRREYEALGFLHDAHPIVLFAHKAKDRVFSSSLPSHIGKTVRFLGWLLTGKLVSTKTGEAMEFLTFEDEFGVVETTFFPKVYHRYAHVLQSGRPYLLSGKVESDFGALTLTVAQVKRI